MNYCATARSRAITIEHLRVVRGKTACGARHLGSDRPGDHHRPARPVRIRQDDADALHRRDPDRRRRHRDGARPPGRSAPRCGDGSATCPRTPTIYDDLKVIDNIRYFASLLRRRTRQAADEVVETGRPAATSAAPAATNLSGGQRARVVAGLRAGRPRPTCWCSTSRPSGSIPCCASDLWQKFTGAGAARHHAAGVQPRDGRGRPLRRSAADARRAHCWPTPRPSRPTRGQRNARHWRKRSCPSSGATTVPTAG